MNRPQTIDDIFDVFSEKGGQMYGEQVTESQHALQCATLAQRNGESPRVISVCLLHDFGHLCHRLGEDIALKGVDALHENIGACMLSTIFGDEILEPIRLHVAAKRYLCHREPGYMEALSESSLRSLQLQGGSMKEEEALEFEKTQCFDSAVRCRRYDDMGKIPQMETPPFEFFRKYLEPFAKIQSPLKRD